MRSLALLLYMAAGVALPAGAVHCRQDDGDVAVMWRGECRSSGANHDAGHGPFLSVPDDCDPPCVDSPLATDPRILPRRSSSSDKELFVVHEAIEYPALTPTLHHFRIQVDSLPPPLLSVRSIVLLI
jgi:hypothetical protein